MEAKKKDLQSISKQRSEAAALSAGGGFGVGYEDSASIDLKVYPNVLQ